MSQTDVFSLWLKRAVLVSALVFLCMLSVLTGVLLLAVIDLRQHVGALSEKTEKVASGLARLEQVFDPDILSEILARGTDALTGTGPGGQGGSSAAGREIAALLDCIGRPELRYEYEGKDRSAAWVRMKLHGKAILLGGEIASAEDFIEKAASKTREGSVYHVIEKSGERLELGDWLRARLREIRSAEAEK